MKRPQIRKSILGRECKEHLIVVDEAWTGRPIDAQVDDLILLPAAAIIEGASWKPFDSDAKRMPGSGRNPGVGRASIPDTGMGAIPSHEPKAICRSGAFSAFGGGGR